MTILDFIKLYKNASDYAEIRVITGDGMEKFIYSDFQVTEVLEYYAGILNQKLSHFEIDDYGALVVYSVTYNE